MLKTQTSQNPNLWRKKNRSRGRESDQDSRPVVLSRCDAGGVGTPKTHKAVEPPERGKALVDYEPRERESSEREKEKEKERGVTNGERGSTTSGEYLRSV